MYRLQAFSEIWRSYLSSILVSDTFLIDLERKIMAQTAYGSEEQEYSLLWSFIELDHCMDEFII